MELKDIRTRKEFAEYLLEWDEVEVEAADLDEVICWFVAMQEAEACSEFTQKDMAHLFLHGIKGIKANPDEAIENWLETLWEDVDYARREGDDIENGIADEEEKEIERTLDRDLRRHFGI
jgi:hypothetical protein